jgi:hypothetical protein
MEELQQDPVQRAERRDTELAEWHARDHALGLAAFAQCHGDFLD